MSADRAFVFWYRGKRALMFHVDGETGETLSSDVLYGRSYAIGGRVDRDFFSAVRRLRSYLSDGGELPNGWRVCDPDDALALFLATSEFSGVPQ